MSSTTPGSDGSRPRDEHDGARQDAGGADRTAIRTSLAERFAAARAEPPVTASPGPSSSVDETVAAEPANRPPSPQTGQGNAQQSAPPASGPRFGATGTSSTSPRPTGAPRPGGPTATATQSYGSGQAQTSDRPSGPRKVRLSVSRVDPWSAMKLSFLLSIAIGIGIVIAAAAMWFLLDSMQVFADIEDLLVTLGSDGFLELMQYAEFDRVISMASIIAVVDILLLTALSTLGAFLYNIVAALVGGLHLTLTDD